MKPCGYYFGKFVDHPAYGPDNPSCPGTVAVVTPTNTTAEKDALARAELALCPLVLGAGLIPFVTNWRLVRAVLVHYETTSRRDLNREVARARELMRNHRRPLRPVLTYTGASVIWNTTATRPGIQAYLDAGETAAAFRARIAALLEEARMRRKTVALHWGAYDRRPLALDLGALNQVQLDLADLVADYRDVIGPLLLFSDGRRGGTRDYPHWYAAHEAAFAALQGPR